MPDAPPIICSFASYLADRMQKRINPEGVVMLVIIVLTDLENAFDSASQQRIENNLVGLPLTYYDIFNSEIPAIARAVFPEDFAKMVETLHADLAAK